MSFIDFVKYKSHQIIYNANRIILNARLDSLFLIGKKTIGLSANDGVHINVGDPKKSDDKSECIVNAPVIRLGLQSKGNSQPVARGADTEAILNSMLDSISSFSSQMSSATGVGVGTVDLAMVNAAAQKLLQEVKLIKKQVQNIKSKTVYTI